MWTSMAGALVPSHIGFTLLSAAASGAASDPFTYLTGLGFPGIIIALLISGQLRTKAEIDRLIKESNRKDGVIKSKDDQIALLQESILKQAFPAMARSAQVIEQIPDTVNSTATEYARTRQEILKLAARLEQLVNGE